MDKNGILGPNKGRSNQIELVQIMTRYDFLWAR